MVFSSHRNEGEQVEWKFYKQLNKIFEKYPLDDTETTVQETKAVWRKNPSRSAKAQSSGEYELFTRVISNKRLVKIVLQGLNIILIQINKRKGDQSSFC